MMSPDVSKCSFDRIRLTNLSPEYTAKVNPHRDSLPIPMPTYDDKSNFVFLVI